MKSASRNFLYAGLILVFLGLLAKSFHIPGATLLILFSTLSLILSLILGFFSRNSSASKRDLSFRKTGSIVFITLGGIVFFFFYTFRIQHWPGTGILTIISFALVIIGALIFLLGKESKTENENLLGR